MPEAIVNNRAGGARWRQQATPTDGAVVEAIAAGAATTLGIGTARVSMISYNGDLSDSRSGQRVDGIALLIPWLPQ